MAKKPYWFRKQGVFGLRLDGTDDEGYKVSLWVGRVEAIFRPRYVRLLDAEKAALRVWKALFGDLP